jgi:hypothetical protein
VECEENSILSPYNTEMDEDSVKTAKRLQMQHKQASAAVSHAAGTSGGSGETPEGSTAAAPTFEVSNLFLA